MRCASPTTAAGGPPELPRRNVAELKPALTPALSQREREAHLSLWERSTPQRRVRAEAYYGNDFTVYVAVPILALFMLAV
jgi:hypothetical protein